MAVPTKGIYIVAAKRSPFGKFGGSLRDVPASFIFAAAAKHVIQSSKLDPKFVDTTVVGNVNFLSQCDGGKTARYCGIYSGVPIERPALAVNKACGSGLQAIINGAQDILTGLARISLTGGVENMSSLPHLVRNVRFGTSLAAPYKLQDYISMQSLDSYSGLTASEVAERSAIEYGVTRADADQFAIDSHRKWKSARDSGIFKSEITPMSVKVKSQEVVVCDDEVPNPGLTLDTLSRLPGNIVTTGNSASASDGAAALLLANEEAVHRHCMTPMARVAGWACVGTAPQDAGLGAAAAISKLVEATGIGLKDVDQFEINESFAAQTLACVKALRLDGSKVNCSGGALAIGHPAGASGARIITHLVHQLSRNGHCRSIGASSIGGGQGIAILIEAV